MSVTVTPKKIRLANPTGRQAPKVGAKRAPRNARPKAAKRNPLHILGASAAALNPHKGGHKSVAQKKQKPAKKQQKKNPAARKSNPFASARPMQTAFKPKRRKRNPDLAASLGQPIELLKFGLIALFGLVATRQVPQLALGTKNESWIGYLANLGTALGGAYGTTKFAGRTAGIAFGTGGGLYTVNRILQDKLTPVGKVLSLAGVGDPMASKSLGRIVPGSLYPPAYDAQGNLRLPPAFVDAARAALLPPALAAGPGVSGVSRLNRGARIAA